MKPGLSLSVGTQFVVGDALRTVVSVDPATGAVALRSGDESMLVTSVRALIALHLEGDALPAGQPAAGSEVIGQPADLDDLTAHQREVLRLRFAHVCEARTGYRSGDPLRARPGEPRAAYDPSTTLLRDRLRAKVGELQGLGSQEAAMPSAVSPAR